MLMIRALRPIVLIRMGTLNCRRIGHFVPDGAEQVARLQAQPTNTVDWFWLGRTCNSQWERMIRRSLPVHSGVKHLDWWNRSLPGGSAHERPNSYTGSREVEGLYERYDVKIPFLPAETDVGLAWLRSKGWTDGEPFVCLLVRDDKYLDKDSLNGIKSTHSVGAWSYHDYRNSDIDSYLPAIQWLNEQGVWVIRMGKLMAKPLSSDMNHVIDYAFDEGKCDLLDIWLFANCTGCVSTATGPDQVSLVYDRPVLFVNALPLGLPLSWGRTIWVPKTLRWAATRQVLSVNEHLANSWLRSTDYETEGIEIVNLTSEEITMAVQEFWQRSSGSWRETQEDQLKQAAYWSTFLEWPDFSKYNGFLHPDARVGTGWLRSVALR